MFKRVMVEDWALCIPIISFIIFAVVFIAVSIRAMCLGKARRDYLASLPLEDNSDTPKL